MIPPQVYKNIADAIDDSIVAKAEAVSEMEVMNSFITEMETSSNNKNILLNALDYAETATKTSHIDTMLNNWLKNLQSIIVKNSGSVNAYLDDNNITVKPNFAALSASLGYPIDPAFVLA